MSTPQSEKPFWKIGIEAGFVEGDEAYIISQKTEDRWKRGVEAVIEEYKRRELTGLPEGSSWKIWSEGVEQADEVRWRFLEKGEIIREGDEVYLDMIPTPHWSAFNDYAFGKPLYVKSPARRRISSYQDLRQSADSQPAANVQEGVSFPDKATCPHCHSDAVPTGRCLCGKTTYLPDSIGKANDELRKEVERLTWLATDHGAQKDKWYNDCKEMRLIMESLRKDLEQSQAKVALLTEERDKLRDSHTRAQAYSSKLDKVIQDLHGYCTEAGIQDDMLGIRARVYQMVTRLKEDVFEKAWKEQMGKLPPTHAVHDCKEYFRGMWEAANKAINASKSTE